jgi:hypothetical protein
LKALERKEARNLVKMPKEMYGEGVWPEDFKREVMTSLQKKSNAEECDDRRAISLIQHAFKFMLKTQR